MYRRIRDLREDNDLTQAEISKILFCSQRNYSHYELGEHDIPTEILIKLAKFYNTSTDYILGLTNEIKPYPKNLWKVGGATYLYVAPFWGYIYF